MQAMKVTATGHDFKPAHAAMQRYIDNNLLSGISSAVLSGRDLVDVNCVGWADKEAQTPLRTDHIFRVFSNTKLITSCAALLLLIENPAASVADLAALMPGPDFPTGGTLIEPADSIRAAYENNAELPTLLTDEDFSKDLADAQEAWRNVVATAVRLGIPVPGFSAALAYYDALRAERLPAALVQGLRDFFGAHTYRRTDRDGTFHTLWAQDRSEESRS